MRFHDIRKTVIKRTGTDSVGSVATPRLLSPFLPGGIKVREGVQTADILQPKYNRARRRELGRTRPCKRIGGVAIARARQPWVTHA